MWPHRKIPSERDHHLVLLLLVLHKLVALRLLPVAVVLVLKLVVLSCSNMLSAKHVCQANLPWDHTHLPDMQDHLKGVGIELERL